MAAIISVNPVLVTAAPGSFSVQSEGYIQGVALDDPAVRHQLAGGILAATETLPMWGGVALTESIPYPPIQTAQPQDQLGTIVARSATVAAITAFSVYNQAHAYVTTPQSEAPAAGQGMTVNFFRLGSRARICVKADPSLASLEGSSIKSQVSWDTTGQLLQPYEGSGGSVGVTSITVGSGANNGVATTTLSAPLPGWTITVGDSIDISGATNSGTAPAALINTSQKVTSVTSSTVFTFQLPVNQGSWGTIGGTIIASYSGGALPCNVLGLNIGNSLVITYDPVNNFVHWDRAGTTAVIEI